MRCLVCIAKPFELTPLEVQLRFPFLSLLRSFFSLGKVLQTSCKTFELISVKNSELVNTVENVHVKMQQLFAQALSKQ